MTSVTVCPSEVSVRVNSGGVVTMTEPPEVIVIGIRGELERVLREKVRAEMEGKRTYIVDN